MTRQERIENENINVRTVTLYVLIEGTIVKWVNNSIVLHARLKRLEALGISPRIIKKERHSGKYLAKVLKGA